MKVISTDAGFTRRFGIALGSTCRPGDIICLGGALGAGKTTLAQAICKGAGVDEHEYVSSPTFAIMHEYQGRIPIYHMDFYRLGGSYEILDLGLDEYFYLQGIVIVEWFEKGVDLINTAYLQVDLSYLDDTSRTIELASSASRWLREIARFQTQFAPL
jgi:tRNA threonylcarbamoyladenosine biosynthesis protein TsaE